MPENGLLPARAFEQAPSDALACRTIPEALDAPTLRQLVRHCGDDQTVINMAAVIVNRGMEAFGARRMNADQVSLFAEKIAEKYPHESLADLNVFMRNASCGDYDGGEYYASIDVARLMKWWGRYLEKKADAREVQAKQSESEQHTGIIQGLAKAGFSTADYLKVRAQAGPAENRSKRDDHLRRTVPVMQDDQLREAYKANKDAWARRIILNEAARRGLLGAEIKEKHAEEEQKDKEAYEKWEIEAAAAAKELDDLEMEANNLKSA